MQDAAQRLHIIANFACDWVYWEGPDGTLQYVSPSAERITGYAPARFLEDAALLETIILPADRATWVRHRHEALTAPPAVREVQFRIRRRDGQVRCIEHLCQPVTDEASAFLGLCVSNRDITHHQQAEAALREQEQRYRALFERTHDAVLILSLDDIYLEANQRAAKMLGCAVEDIVGKSFMEFIAPGEYEDARAKGEALLAGEELPVYERIMRRLDGTEFPVEVNLALVYDADGHPSHYHSLVRDISERKRAETARIESEARYRALFEHNNDAVFIVSLEGVHLAANPRAAEMLGCAVEDIVGRPALDFVAPQEREQGQARIAALLAGERLPVYERTFRRPDGTEFPAEINVALVRDAAGKPSHLQSIVRDITARKQAEGALRESEARLRALSEATFEAVFLSEQGIILELNQAAERMFGYTRDEVVGSIGPELIVPQDRARVMDHVLSGYEEPYEVTALRKDGTTFPAEIRGKMIRYQGRTVRVTALRDITRLKETEEALARERNLLRTLIDTVPDYIYVKDTQARFLLDNIADARVMGAATPDDVVGKTDFDFHPPDLAAQYYADDMAVLQTGQPLLNQEEMIIDADGRERWLLTTKVPLRDEQGRIIGLAGSGRDITETKQAEKERLALLLQQERTRLLSDFIRDASHEFRTPLSVINTNAYLLGKAVETERGQALLRAIGEQADYIGELVEAMLTMSELDSQAGFTLAPLDLNSLIREMDTRMRPLAEAKRLALTLDLAGDLPLVAGDAPALYQALIHLLENAIQYTPEGGTITVRTAPQGQHAVVEFRDTGEGISPQDLPHIFERFYRGDKARTRRGVGMGLPMARKIVEAHQGRIEVESAPGQGSTFRVLLPTGQ